MSGSNKTDKVYKGWESSVTYPGDFIISFINRAIDNTNKRRGSKVKLDYLVEELDNIKKIIEENEKLQG